MSRHQKAEDVGCGGELATEASELSWAMHYVPAAARQLSRLPSLFLGVRVAAGAELARREEDWGGGIWLCLEVIGVRGCLPEAL